MNSPAKSLPPAVDLIIVLDAGWPYKDAMTLLSYLIDKLDLGEYGEGVGVGGGGGSTFTLMTGRNTQNPPIVNSSSTPLDFYGNFTKDLYNSLQAGMDLSQVLIKLRTMYAATMEIERDRRTTTGRPQVALFITYMSSVLSDSERSAARNAYNRLRIKAPNTHFIYWTLGSKDQYRDFVIDKDKDLIQISSVSDFQSSVQVLMENLNSIPRRILNCACTYRWESNGESGKSIQYADPLGRPLLFNLHPNFFFKSDKATVKFQGQGYGSLQICYSRNPITGNSSSSSSSKPNCKTITSETAEFSESQPCSGTDYISSCKQMYFSVTPTSSNPRCFDKYCRYPDMIRFTVTHEGLTCANSAKGLLLSGTSATLFIVMLSLRELLMRLFFFG
ncbi:hypothetical protein J437_LFUL008977 [Ladona fulva]|uniref:Uncharacterized protein n=1 Tax=Ladona fulva TaxID=123851 RepID=A0A8K0K537_LADFU|nr:hypothetical protein J437_LFUL008977 [Ladona fulva]